MRGPHDQTRRLALGAGAIAVGKTRYNKTTAAKKLGITFRALRYKLKKLGID